MRGLHLVLLTVLLSSDCALSLQCYLCAGIQAATQCQAMPCREGQNVCYKGDLISTWLDGQVSMRYGACAHSCEEASRIMQTKANAVPGLNLLDKPVQGLSELGPKMEVHGFSCCEKDLCNKVSRAVRSLWALAGGLLLSLGPVFLWALL